MNLADINTTYPKWLPTNTQYLCYMGSFAYGVSTVASDLDVYGFAIPPKEYVYAERHIFGFDEHKTFNEWAQHHVHYKEKVYDFTVFNIVKYFANCMNCNPNAIDALFVPLNCVAKITAVGNKVRENRHLFLCKKAWHTFKGYAYSELAASTPKRDVKEIRELEDEYQIPHSLTFAEAKDGKGLSHLTDEVRNLYIRMYQQGLDRSKRFEMRKIHNGDLKNLYHVVRLLSQVEQILIEEDLTLDLVGRKEHMMAIRKGEIPIEDIIKWAASKEKDLESVYVNSKLRNTPDKEGIRSLLAECLDIHYGSQPKVEDDECRKLLLQIQRLVENV